tara:strand:+ start:313 stop:1032 length:720 start_codon:yes stop_codon:yes gene_type:complete
MADKKFTYDDKKDIIDAELKKRRGKWFLNSVSWIDFDDVCQIIRAHIYKKWEQWDQSRALEPWLNRIISNQLKNILRNNYSNFSRPCLNCPFNQSKISGESDVPGELCGFTPSGLQCNECPLYAKWEKTKKHAYDIKMAVSIEACSAESFMSGSQTFDIDEALIKLNKELKKVLNDKQYTIYKMLFIENKTEEEVAKKMGYRTNEKGRKAGYKQIKNLKKTFKQKILSILEKKDIIIHE